MLFKSDPAKIRRAIVREAVRVCERELKPFKATRPWDYDAVWRIVTSFLVEFDKGIRDPDIYCVLVKLDYYAFECTTSYMDIALKLRRALSLHWLSETRTKIHKESRTWPASEKNTASTPKQPKGASRPRRSSSPAKTSSRR